MKYWTAVCPEHGVVKIKQKTKPTTCKVDVLYGKRSFRKCAGRLTDQKDVTVQVEAHFAAKKKEEA